MIQGIIAIILLVLAVIFYVWGRRPARSSAVSHRQKDPHPDVVLGLVKEAPETEVISALSKPEPSQPTQKEILFLRAPAGRQYGGYELLQCLLTNGLRFGEYHIFHRYEQRPEERVILFSVAAATVSGQLDPEKIGDFSCAGLTIFMTLNDHAYPSVVFELMLDTARQLAEDLGGVVLDVEQSPLDSGRLPRIRERIKQFEMHHQNMELFV
jgi:cell division protein ZipA